jgi:hypothetical protein
MQYSVFVYISGWLLLILEIGFRYFKNGSPVLGYFLNSLSGNAQGKMQPSNTLRGFAKHDYLLQQLQGGKTITMNIRLPTGRGEGTH